MTKKFVVVVDAQNDFMQPNGALYVPGSDVVVPRINDYLKGLNPSTTAGVLFTYDTHEPGVYEASEEAKMFPNHCFKKTWGWQLAVDPKLVNPLIPLYSLTKDVFNMWEKPTVLISAYNQGYFNRRGEGMTRWCEPYTDVCNNIKFMQDRDVLINEIRKDFNDVEVVGVAADFCVKWAGDGFLARDFNVTIPADLTAGIERDINAVVAEMAQTYPPLNSQTRTVKVV